MGTRSSRFPFHRFSPACAFPKTSLQKLCAQRRLDCCLQTKFTLKRRHMPPAISCTGMHTPLCTSFHSPRPVCTALHMPAHALHALCMSCISCTSLLGIPPSA